jgi:hypothetical protein
MTQSPSIIKFVMPSNRQFLMGSPITIDRRFPDDLSASLPPSSWEVFCIKVDEALYNLSNARRAIRNLAGVHVLLAGIFLILQILMWAGVITLFRDPWYWYGYPYWYMGRSDLNWIPIFIFIYLFLAVILVCIRRRIIRRSRAAFIERMEQLCIQD